MIHSIRIPRSEFAERKEVLLNYVRERHLRGAVIFDSTNILYYSGFAFIPTERPIIYVLSASGEQALFVPRLELEHVKAETGVDRVGHYREYPGLPRPEVAFKEMLAEMKMLGGEGEIGADMDGYPWILGYEGPRLSELTDLKFVNIHPFVYRQQWIKSANELALIRESCKWGHLAHVLLQRYTRPGVTETEVSLRASTEATLAMMDTIGPIYRAQGWGGGPSAGYRGQIGRNAAIPHALANNIVFQPGDVLVTGAGCLMWGYHSELERTMFIGEPTAEQQALFHHVKNAQEIAFAAMKPGVKCSEVDDAVRAYYEKNKLTAHWKHHSGHAIGLRYHEGPYLDSGDDTVLRPGMVFTVEPGFYSAELGGYRHSDTVAITADGIEQMTYYPRDLEPLIIPV